VIRRIAGSGLAVPYERREAPGILKNEQKRGGLMTALQIG